MKKLLAFLAFTAAAIAAEPVVSIDLYGNVFLNGENTNQQIADFARNKPALAPQVDGAVRAAVIAARDKIAVDIAAGIKSANDARDAAIAANAAELASAKTEAAKVAGLTAEIDALKAKVAQLESELAAEKAKNAPPQQP